MKSISRKILKATLFWLIVIIILMTITSIAVVTGITKTDSEELLTQVCEKETLKFNNEFNLLENSVMIITRYIQDLENECNTQEEMLSDSFSDKIQDMTLSIANRTDGAMAVYFRYNPELTGNGTGGFLWSRNNSNENFSYFEPTDILKYDQNDTEHVGWFYEPKKRREAMWMSPYYNKNLDVFMISYVVPYYTKSGEFLGVIGMDIDFNEITKLASEVSIYKSGRLELIDLATYLIYSSDRTGGVQLKNLSISIYNHITTIDREDEILKLKDNDGNDFLTCTGKLLNGMRLILYVPVKEISEQRNNMLYAFAIIMVFVISITVIIMVRLTNKMVNPLKKLTRITEKYANGDWSDTYVADTEDEIQELSESISVMAGMTKTYIDKINENAMTDALTGLKNKNCYLSHIERYKENNPEIKEYAVIVFDINYLKKVNDEFGHELGDKLIKLAGDYICSIFEHDNVFRIGGDEYNVILEGNNYEIRNELCEKFENGMKQLPPVVDDIPLSISYGMASYPKDDDNYDAVFKCADDRMYEYKKKIKAARI